MPRTPDLPSLLLEVVFALGSAEIVEQILVDYDQTNVQYCGYADCADGVRPLIFVNPLQHRRRRDVVSTLLHEGLHHARPRWSEARVTALEPQLLALLSEEQAAAIYRNYKAVVRKLARKKRIRLVA